MNTKALIIPDDYKDVIYRITYFFMGKVAGYIPASIKPNQITIAAFASGMIGTILLFLVQSPIACLYWIFFNFVWYLLDALDGIHARLTQQTSEYGAFLDHALDNIYFIFMFTVFAYRFDLGHVLYIYIMLLRFTAAVMVFTIQCHTGRLYLSKISGGGELILMSLALFLTLLFPHFNPANHTVSPMMLRIIHVLSLQHGFFMKLALLPYFIGIPITFVLQFQFVKKELATQ